VALHLAEGRRHAIGFDLDFLQADDVRALVRDPVLELRLPRPDAVDVPGGDFQCDAWAACRSAGAMAISAGCAPTWACTTASALAIGSASALRYTALASIRSFWFDGVASMLS